MVSGDELYSANDIFAMLDESNDGGGGGGDGGGARGSSSEPRLLKEGIVRFEESLRGLLRLL